MARKRLRIALALATAAFVSMPQVAAGLELTPGRRAARGRVVRARARALRERTGVRTRARAFRGRTVARAGARMLRAEALQLRARTRAIRDVGEEASLMDSEIEIIEW